MKKEKQNKKSKAHLILTSWRMQNTSIYILYSHDFCAEQGVKNAIHKHFIMLEKKLMQ